ncbi:MAG: DUF3987 domain-containing protein [Planctomycetota bacterium]
MNYLEIAKSYLSVGLSVLPAKRDQKRPALFGWKSFQSQLPTVDQIESWFESEQEALCIVTGAVSANLELLDFDFGAELYDAWAEQIPTQLLSRLVIESSKSGGRHVIYRCNEPICGNIKLAQDRRDGQIQTLIETRGQGGLFLCSPTAGYDLIQGNLTDIPILIADERERLLEAAWKLNRIAAEIHSQTANIPPADLRPGDDFNQRGDVREILKKHGWKCVKSGENQYWRRPGKPDGWSASLKENVFFVHSANAHPFEPERGYPPFAVYCMLEHGGDFAAAARQLRLDGFGEIPNVQIFQSKETVEPKQPATVDPGRLPEDLFDVPGLIRQVMDFTLANAPYPNVGLAFCGAVALQSFLAGRKVCTEGDLRTNIYLLALASSGTGKEFPRKVNSQVLHQVGLSSSLGDKFASGEGIQDALIRTGCMLFQNDEMDGVLRQINSDQDNRRESIPNILLTLYTSASDIYPTRVKANQKEAIHVDQPHLTLFGTATPRYFYESLSRRMLSNGFFARLNIIDVGRRSEGQKPGSARNLPDSILKTAKWWAQFDPGDGNFMNFHPAPKVVQFTPEAESAIEELRCMTEVEYAKAEEENDEVGRTAWSRTCEHATKLALIYACSENHIAPKMTIEAVRWASEFARHQTRRQLFLAGVHVADNPFHAECLKLMKILRDQRNQKMARRELMRAMRCKAADFDQVIGTLTQWGEVEMISIPSATKSATGYQLI